MTDDKIALRELLEKGSDATFLREMIGFAATRLMELLMGHYSENELDEMERWCTERSLYFLNRTGWVFQFRHEGDAFYFRKAFDLAKGS
jgi:hypothetical protein